MRSTRGRSSSASSACSAPEAREAREHQKRCPRPTDDPPPTARRRIEHRERGRQCTLLQACAQTPIAGRRRSELEEALAIGHAERSHLTLDESAQNLDSADPVAVSVPDGYPHDFAIVHSVRHRFEPLTRQYEHESEHGPGQ